MEANKSLFPIVAVFPGQGSQAVGMGKSLFENFKVAREAFEEASDAIQVDLKKLCFEGPDSDLLLTENTQPCLLTTSVAAFRSAEAEFGFKPHAVAGHSLGEYSALVACKSLGLTQAVRFVRERGAAMQKAVPVGAGTMAALMGLEDSEVEALCTQATQVALEKRQNGQTEDQPALQVDAIVQPANFNTPGQVVIAGSADAVQEALLLMKSNPSWSKGKGIPLQVSAPFHCKLMAPARNRMAELFSKLSSGEQIQRPSVPYVPNRTGRATQEQGVVLELLIEQIDHPVLWKQSVQTLLSLPGKGTDPAPKALAVEFGPGKVLGGMIKRIASASSIQSEQHSVQDLDTLRKFETIWRSLV